MKAVNDDQFAASRERRIPPTVEPSPGVVAIPVEIGYRSPVPFTYCYAVIGGSRAVVIDPGHDTPGNLERILGELEERGVVAIEGILLTHLHSDHVALAATLQDAVDAPVMINAADRDAVPALAQGRGDPTDRLRGWGVPHDAIEAILTVNRDQAAVLPPRVARWLVDGDRIDVGTRSLEVIATPGHQPGHLCFRDAAAGLLFAGDHLLPTVFPGLQGLGTGADNALVRMLESLERVRAFADDIVLPGHGYAYTGVVERADAMERRYLDRAAEMAGVLRDRPGATIWEVATSVKWSGGAIDRLRGTYTFYAAIEQTMIHVDRLRMLAETSPARA